jgi:hypothetical protein
MGNHSIKRSIRIGCCDIEAGSTHLGGFDTARYFKLRSLNGYSPAPAHYGKEGKKTEKPERN